MYVLRGVFLGRGWHWGAGVAPVADVLNFQYLVVWLQVVVVVAQVMKHGIAERGDQIHGGRVSHYGFVCCFDLVPGTLIVSIPRVMVVHNVYRLSAFFDLVIVV